MNSSTYKYIDDNFNQTISDLKRLVAQPSISAQKVGITECAEMVAEELTNAGLIAKILPTSDPAYPVVIAETPDADSEKTLLFYNHYDVQPPDPLDEWESPPFEPFEKNGYIFGRGISDDKGPFIARLAAIKALPATTGLPPLKIRFCLEGAEEIGSPGFHEFLEQNKNLLKSDACIWEGGGVNWDGRPLITLGVKGLLYVELECRAASRDSHSSYAPTVPNPAWRLIWALSSIKGIDEKINIRGFYDKIRPPLQAEIDALNSLPDTDSEFKKDLGVEVALGEATGFEFRRRMIMDPTCNVAGIVGGYIGQGAKTILPATAKVKVDFRLVPDQDPKDVLNGLRQHLDENGFSDISINVFTSQHPSRTPLEDPFVNLVASTAETVYGSKPYIQPSMTGTGPQYPVQHILGVPVASCGIDYPGNRIHAPNENINLDYFKLGIMHTAELINQFGSLGK